MNAKLHYDRRAARPGRVTRTRGMIVGLIGGLVGTIVMDLFGAGLFLMMGGPASLSFAIIGDAAAGGFALLGITLAVGTLLLAGGITALFMREQLLVMRRAIAGEWKRWEP